MTKFALGQLLAIYEYLTVLKARELERRHQGLPI